MNIVEELSQYSIFLTSQCLSTTDSSNISWANVSGFLTHLFVIFRYFWAVSFCPEVDKTRNFHGITEKSDKYGNVRGIVNKTRNFDNGITENSDKYGDVRGIVNKTRKFHNGITENSDKYGNVRGIVNKTRNFDIS